MASLQCSARAPLLAEGYAQAFRREDDFQPFCRFPTAATREQLEKGSFQTLSQVDWSTKPRPDSTRHAQRFTELLIPPNRDKKRLTQMKIVG